MYWIVSFTWITAVILELIHADKSPILRGAFIRSKPNGSAVSLVILNNFGLIVWLHADDISIQGVPYQLSTVA